MAFGGGCLIEWECGQEFQTTPALSHEEGYKTTATVLVFQKKEEEGEKERKTDRKGRGFRTQRQERETKMERSRERLEKEGKR
jgi:hypothetical protein